MPQASGQSRLHAVRFVTGAKSDMDSILHRCRICAAAEFHPVKIRRCVVQSQRGSLGLQTFWFDYLPPMLVNSFSTSYPGKELFDGHKKRAAQPTASRRPCQKGLENRTSRNVSCVSDSLLEEFSPAESPDQTRHLTHADVKTQSFRELGRLTLSDDLPFSQGLWPWQRSG